jgi:hypothetical protein
VLIYHEILVKREGKKKRFLMSDRFVLYGGAWALELDPLLGVGSPLV